MRTVVNLAICLALMTVPAVCRAQQAANAQQALQGLLTGEKVHDRLLVEAFNRGYQRGVEDAQQKSKAEIAAEVAKAKSDCKIQN